MKTNRHIKRFINYFTDQLGAIDAIKVPDDRLQSCVNVNIFRKILYTSIIDALSGIRYPDIRHKNRGKLIRFLDDYSCWYEKDLVSLPILIERLRIVKGYTRLKRYLRLTMEQSSAKYGSSLDIMAVDKCVQELNILTQNPVELKLIDDTRHKYLFYTYRNFIVHEFREPGYGMNVFGEGIKPVYHGYVGEHNRVLTYPPPCQDG